MTYTQNYIMCIAKYNTRYIERDYIRYSSYIFLRNKKFPKIYINFDRYSKRRCQNKK